METLVFGGRRCTSAASLQSFAEYRNAEKNTVQLCGTSSSGELLEYETLVCRLSPPNVEIDNVSDPQRTVITIDSANRPGTLVELVQHFTEHGLEVHRARISSDGGWFVDVFEVSESNGEKVKDPVKLASIQQMLNVHFRQEAVPGRDDADEYYTAETTVFELAGADKAGLLAEVTELLDQNDCHVRSAAVWTYNGRVAFVLSVTERGVPVSEHKLEAFQGRLLALMDHEGEGIVRIREARGEVHHDRRLHQLMLLEESKEWVRRTKLGPAVIKEEEEEDELCAAASECYIRAATSPTDSVSSLHDGLSESVAVDFRSPKHSTPKIRISKCSDRKYWLVNIECKDRNKLLFDTVCTLADLNYDVFHATIDSEGGKAVQEYYIKSRSGSVDWDEGRASKLRALLEASIQRRFPKGLKVHVRSMEKNGCLTDLTQRLRAANLSITRAKVKAHSNQSSGHTFYVMDASGSAPDFSIVEEACRTIGGKMVDNGEQLRHAHTIGPHRFSFSFLDRQWRGGWGGSPSSPASSSTSC